MLPLGTKAPHFRLSDPDGNEVSLDDFLNAKGYLIAFICNHCPYVKHIRKGLAEITQAFISKGIAVIGINSNDVEKYPDDSPQKMKIEAATYQYKFPYLFDETQETAKAYKAACTPDFFLFNADKKLVYRGQLDDSRPGNEIPVTGKDLKAAVESMLLEKPISDQQKPSLGCNIKWKPGKEPDYF